MKIALCIVATNNYINFVEPLLESAEAFFLKGHDVTYHIFTNQTFITAYHNVECHTIEHKPWPAMTLNRYAFILSTDLSTYDFIYYIDADSLFVAPIGDEILKDMIVVSHPGYYAKGGGSWESNDKSTAYVAQYFRKHYVCGGFQGGSQFIKIAYDLHYNILNDKDDGVTAIWHDESHLNYLYSCYHETFTRLDCSYMMPESIEKRKAWHINHIEPKILALEKDHKNYQK
jgi:hypothetical protein